ncbi:hypothetical protein M3I53_25150 [Paraburkholderia sp. CNPSo 3272]|uniref:hypothetical protein n=1 Tax=Paraburkholderia sp. CNPSo 3272 TaxID=2940931 RepID=UPI0020B8FF10|nr:hypothetical protein [Paraburkholderia sp. CNPSo 3272]MCP3726377.1 hypothetical protein [Paraburkholderia sp. CNPSo 3272]
MAASRISPVFFIRRAYRGDPNIVLDVGARPEQNGFQWRRCIAQCARHRQPDTILPGDKRMLESISMSVVAVFAGSCLTFLIAILLPEPVVAKGARGGLYAGLGNEDESLVRTDQARTRRFRALQTWRAGGRPPGCTEAAPRPFNRRRAGSACPARAH